MKKQILLIAMLVSALIGFIPTETKASHWAGGDITYTYVSSNTYLVRLRFYRDAAGIPVPATVPLCYSSTNPISFSSTITLNPVGIGVPINQSPCVPPGSGYNIEEYVYEGVLVLPHAAIDWTLSYTDCCRNGAITTIQPNNWMIYCKLDNQNFPTNNSPNFAFQPVTEFCINNPFYFQQGAFDIDGDSLVFSLSPAYNDFSCPLTFTPVTYNAGFSATAPFSSSVPITCDLNTGTIFFIPNAIQTGVMDVLVEEFDPFTGVKKGETIRDIQVNIVANCNIIPPAYDSTFNANGVSITVDGVLNLACDDTTFILEFDSTAKIQCGSIVPTDIRVTLPSGLPNPVVSAVGINCSNGLTSSILVTVLNPFPAGTSYAYTKVGNDGNTFLSECGSSMPELDSIALVITDSSVLVVDSTSALVGCVFDKIELTFNQPLFCFGIASNGSDFTVVDANGNNIPVTGALCGGAANPNAPYSANLLTILTNPGTTGVGPLYVISNIGSDGNSIANTCETYINANDTIAVVTVLTYIPVNFGPDVTQCDRPPYPILDMGVLAPTAVFNWTLNGSSVGTNNDSLLANQSGTYIGVVGVGAVCSGSDTIVVDLLAIPTVTITDGATALPDTLNLCPGDPIPSLSSTTTGTGYQWFNNGVAVLGATTPTFTPTSAGLYSVQSVATGAPCIGSDQIRIIINSAPFTNIGNDQTICSNQAAPVLSTSSINGVTYQWTANGSIVTGATTNQYQPASPNSGLNTYQVTATNAAGCSSSASMNLLVIQINAVALGNDVSYCAGVTPADLDANTTGAISYQWYNNGGIITGASNAQLTPVTGQNDNYIVVVDFGSGCTSTDTVAVSFVTQITVSTTDVTYCQGSTPGALTASSTVSGLTYTWSFNGNQVGTGQSFVPTNGTGIYTVVGDFNGQCNGTATANVTEIEVPQAMSITGAANYCVGETVNPIQSDYSANGQFNTVYSWTENGNAFGGNTQSITPSNTVGNYTYVVTVTNSANGTSCNATATAQVNINPTPSLDVLNNDTYCFDDQIDSLVALANVPPGQTFVWTDQNGTVVSNNSSYTPNTVVGTNTYTVETDLNGCKNTASATITINALPQPALSATVKGQSYSDNVPFCLSENPIPQIVAGLSGNYNYSWTLNGTLLSNTASTQNIEQSGVYEVTVTDQNNCKNSDVITTVEIPCTLVFYNIITPDGNGQNDVFVIENLENYAGKKLVIYNRWGKEVFSSDSYDNKWNGGDLSAGSYFYVLDTNNGVEERSYKGILEIVK
ncbi:MAG TPA: gliding motility-associated C-terminal domain-containing protein [Bacteroidia bacterium]|nr:gliding motility-associated C-terminal domain-containing protein [Bacteroidia bacterium]HNU34686.1 gliding motility-associated C-terminal domain-containing protein [Bacteroidia bacterium]